MRQMNESLLKAMKNEKRHICGFTHSRFSRFRTLQLVVVNVNVRLVIGLNYGVHLWVTLSTAFHFSILYCLCSAETDFDHDFVF